MASPRGDGQYVIINAVTGKEAHLETFFTIYVSMIMLLVVVVV